MEARGGAEREATGGAGARTIWRGALLGGAISAAVLALMFARSPNFERADGPEAAVADDRSPPTFMFSGRLLPSITDPRPEHPVKRARRAAHRST